LTRTILDHDKKLEDALDRNLPPKEKLTIRRLFRTREMGIPIEGSLYENIILLCAIVGPTVGLLTYSVVSGYTPSLVFSGVLFLYPIFVAYLVGGTLAAFGGFLFAEFASRFNRLPFYVPLLIALVLTIGTSRFLSEHILRDSSRVALLTISFLVTLAPTIVCWLMTKAMIINAVLAQEASNGTRVSGWKTAVADSLQAFSIMFAVWLLTFLILLIPFIYSAVTGNNYTTSESVVLFVAGSLLVLFFAIPSLLVAALVPTVFCFLAFSYSRKNGFGGKVWAPVMLSAVFLVIVAALGGQFNEQPLGLPQIAAFLGCTVPTFLSWALVQHQ
jgi:hypothetical protein